MLFLLQIFCVVVRCRVSFPLPPPYRWLLSKNARLGLSFVARSVRDEKRLSLAMRTAALAVVTNGGEGGGSAKGQAVAE